MRDQSWFGADTRNAMLNRDRIDLVGEPPWVPRLAGQVTGKAVAQIPKELGGEILVKDQAGRELDQQGPKPGSKQLDFIQGARERLDRIRQACRYGRLLLEPPQRGGTLAAHRS